MRTTALDLGRDRREVSMCTLVEVYIDVPVHSGRLKMMLDLDDLFTDEQWATLETWIADRFDAEYAYVLAKDALDAEHAASERLAKRHARLRAIAYPSEPTCLGCGETDIDALQIDHIVPRSRGGLNKMHNLQLLCGPCNQDKGPKTMAEWRGGEP